MIGEDSHALVKQVAQYRAEVEQMRKHAAHHRAQIASHEEGARGWEQEAAVLEARIAGLQEAAELLGLNRDDPPPVEQRRRSRRLSPQWQKMMQFVDMLDRSFHYEDLVAAAEAAGHEVGRDTLRSQMSLYRGSGLVKTDYDGGFRLTGVGRSAAGITPAASFGPVGPKENEPPAGRPADGSEAGEGGVAPPSPPQSHSSSGSDA